MTFIKGRSGNPKGRPRRGTSVSEALRRALRERDPITGASNQAKIVETLWTLAIQERSLEAIKVILDRVDGKVPNAPELAADDETILVVADL